MDIQKQKHSIGVLILIIYASVFTGILPLLLFLLLLSSGSAASVLGGRLNSILYPILSIGIIITSIYAWQGKDRAKYLLLILIAVHYLTMGLIFIGNLMNW